LFRPREDASGQRCPGEAACDIFQGADPETTILENGKPVKIGRLSACRMCDLRHTKPGSDQVETSDIVLRIEKLVNERDAGFPVDTSTISPLEAELIVYWTRCVRSWERSEQRMLTTLLAGVMGIS
jgi:hypothetical protein